MSKETHATGGVMEDLDGNAMQVDTVSSVGTLLDLPDYDAETMKTLKSITFEPIILEATIRLGEDESKTTIETTFYEQLHNVSVYMNVIGFQKSASSITLHGGFNGQSLFVNGDYASYTVGGKVYDVKVEAEADSRRRLDDHHARVGGQRRFLFENTEAMNEYHDEMHRNVGTFEVGVVFCCVALCLIVALLFCLSALTNFLNSNKLSHLFLWSFFLYSHTLRRYANRH